MRGGLRVACTPPRRRVEWLDLLLCRRHGPWPSRDHSVEEGLDYVMVWNAGMLLRSTDLTEAMTAMKQKRKPAFSKL